MEEQHFRSPNSVTFKVCAVRRVLVSPRVSSAFWRRASSTSCVLETKRRRRVQQIQSLRAEAAQSRTPPLNTFLPALALDTLCFSAVGNALSRTPSSVTCTPKPRTAGNCLPKPRTARNCAGEGAVTQSRVSRPKVVYLTPYYRLSRNLRIQVLIVLEFAF